MKKFIYILFLFLLTCSFVNAETITFMDETYELQNVKKISSEYVNEYFSPSSNKITLHYMPKEESEFDFINDFVRDINQNPEFNLTGFYPNINTFSYEILTGKDENKYIEYNAVKCVPDKKKGVIALQFTKRYQYNDKASFLSVYDESMKNNLQYIDAVFKTQIPPVIKKKK